MDRKQEIEKLVKENKIVVFMKGVPEAPQCGFSARTVKALQALGHPIKTVDILADDELRGFMKQYSEWPTFPQVYINGEFVGGCDIIVEMEKRGELAKLMQGK